MLCAGGGFSVGGEGIAHFVIENAGIGHQHSSPGSEGERQAAQMTVSTSPFTGVKGKVIRVGLPSRPHEHLSGNREYLGESRKLRSVEVQSPQHLRALFHPRGVTGSRCGAMESLTPNNSLCAA